MISKEDVEGYLDGMLKLEFDMQKKYTALAKKVKDPKIKEKFKGLVKDEGSHASLVKELQALLKKWK